MKDVTDRERGWLAKLQHPTALTWTFSDCRDEALDRLEADKRIERYDEQEGPYERTYRLRVTELGRLAYKLSAGRSVRDGT